MYKGPAGLAGALPVSLSFTNLTSGNAQALRVGDEWLAEVHGNGGAGVTVTGSRDGKAVSFPPIGMTDDSGVFQLRGRALADQVGAWVENWSVGGAHAGTLIFTILPLPAATPGKSDQTFGATSDEILAALRKENPDQFQVGSIPIWMWVAGGLGAVLLIKGGR